MDHALKNIDERRQRLGIAQVELCRRADVNESTLSRARRHSRQPTKRILKKLDAALDQIARERGIAIIGERAP